MGLFLLSEHKSQGKGCRMGWARLGIAKHRSGPLKLGKSRPLKLFGHLGLTWPKIFF